MQHILCSLHHGPLLIAYAALLELKTARLVACYLPIRKLKKMQPEIHIHTNVHGFKAKKKKKNQNVLISNTPNFFFAFSPFGEKKKGL